MQQNVTPSSFAAASCHRQSNLCLKLHWVGTLWEELLAQEEPENHRFTQQLYIWESSFIPSAWTGSNLRLLVQQKHMSWSKEWKPGNSSGFGGISPPAGQPMALGGNTIVSSFHLCPSVFPLCSLSQLTLGRYPELGKMWCLQCVIFYWYRNVFS